MVVKWVQNIFDLKAMLMVGTRVQTMANAKAKTMVELMGLLLVGRLVAMMVVLKVEM